MVETSDLCRNEINQGKQKLIMASIQAMSRGHTQTPKPVLQRDKTRFNGRDDQLPIEKTIVIEGTFREMLITLSKMTISLCTIDMVEVRHHLK